LPNLKPKTDDFSTVNTSNKIDYSGVLSELEKAKLWDKTLAYLEIGLSITDACKYSSLPINTYYSWLDKDDSKQRATETAKLMPKAKALQNILKAGSKDWHASAWYLEHKYPSEFGNKVELNNNYNQNNWLSLFDIKQKGVKPQIENR